MEATTIKTIMDVIERSNGAYRLVDITVRDAQLIMRLEAPLKGNQTHQIITFIPTKLHHDTEESVLLCQRTIEPPSEPRNGQPFRHN